MAGSCVSSWARISLLFSESSRLNISATARMPPYDWRLKSPSAFNFLPMTKAILFITSVRVISDQAMPPGAPGRRVGPAAIAPARRRLARDLNAPAQALSSANAPIAELRKLLRIGLLDGIEVRHVRSHGLHHAV